MTRSLVARILGCHALEPSRNSVPPRRSIAALLLLSILFLPLPSSAESAHSLYDKGRKAEAQQHYEAAYEFFKAAHDKEPQQIRYRSAYERLRVQAAMVKVRRGQLLRAQ